MNSDGSRCGAAICRDLPWVDFASLIFGEKHQIRSTESRTQPASELCVYFFAVEQIHVIHAIADLLPRFRHLQAFARIDMPSERAVERHSRRSRTQLGFLRLGGFNS